MALANYFKRKWQEEDIAKGIALGKAEERKRANAKLRPLAMAHLQRPIGKEILHPGRKDRD